MSEIKMGMNQRMVEQLWDVITRRYIKGEISFEEYIQKTSEIAQYIDKVPFVKEMGNETSTKNMKEIIQLLKDIKALLEQLNTKIPTYPPVIPWYPITPPQTPWYPVVPPTVDPFWVTTPVTSTWE